MTRKYAFTPRAFRQLRNAKSWWLDHRDKAPDAFDDDIADQIGRLLSNPYLGSAVRNASRSNTRRVLLPRIRYYLYYRVQDERLLIIALWHSSRRPPKL